MKHSPFLPMYGKSLRKSSSQAMKYLRFNKLYKVIIVVLGWPLSILNQNPTDYGKSDVACNSNINSLFSLLRKEDSSEQTTHRFIFQEQIKNFVLLRNGMVAILFMCI